MTRHNRAGYSLIELMVVVAIIAVVASVGVPISRTYMQDQTAGAVVRAAANVFRVARQEAIRTGNIHVVFTNVGGAGDVAGTSLVDSNGDPAPLLVLDDGRPGSANQNCKIDLGENTQTAVLDDSASQISWGPAIAGSAKPADDTTPASTASGSTFVTQSGAPATWVAFRPDGIPVAFDAACNIGQIGSGNGALYVSNGRRDYAVVLSSLGDVRIHQYDRVTGAWTN